MTLGDDKRALLTDGRSFIGRAVLERWIDRGEVAAIDPTATDLTTVASLYATHRPHVVIHTAEVGGGIAAHRAHPGLRFHANAAMALNLIAEGRKAGVERFIYVGTADAYPGDAPVPMRESDLWAGRTFL